MNKTVEKDNSNSGDNLSWNNESDQRFTDYYEEASQSDHTIERFSELMKKLLRLIYKNSAAEKLEVADIGCGPGAQAILWSQKGHAVHGVDINKNFIDIGRKRALEQQLDIDFSTGSATELPWADNSMDVVLLPELLEHVADWKLCLNEAVRILKPGGTLFLSTSNKLCPVQREFKLPLYSWYPGKLKRHYEKLSVTTRPELVNHAAYPAVNWFSYYGLSKELKKSGMKTMDRFDFNLHTTDGLARQIILRAICTLPPLRFMAHVATSHTFLVATKH